MTTSPDLHRLLELAAQSHEPPVDGPERVLALTRRPERISTAPAKRLAGRMGPRRPALAALSGMAVVVLALAIVAGMRFGAGGPSSSGSASSAGSAVPGTAAAPTQGAGPAAVAGGTAPGAPTRSRPVPGTQARVVQTAQLALRVPPGTLPAALDRLAGVATGLSGYVAQSHSDQNGSEQPDTPASGTVTLRVPAAAYVSASKQARAVGQVTSASSQAQDVTGEYVDLSARISALAQTRATYLTLLSKAGSIGDTLAVQQQIEDVQTQIEQLQGQQKVLADTSDLATVTVTVTETGTSSPVASRSGFGGAFHHAVSGFATGLQGLIAISGPLLFVALVLAFIALLGRAGYRLARRRLL